MKLNPLEQLVEEIDEARICQIEAIDQLDEARKALDEAMVRLRTGLEDFQFWQRSNAVTFTFVTDD